ncbi:GTP-binding protein [Streptomyces scabiei]|uniref:GTP-binding protein n=1 Tax=Streptomyces scabiei TaxID=1930 RepID=UPI0029B84ED1|nr:ATP/GTP-binding protein [Streptomyces scabiei]MDX2531554.1 ATP/GTP-binding protein [Streptomyces scabiei]MDX2796612.1 ATP/GTP-binding protein [Streptomyces scabiei]MDX2862443.1 ATP/GTP-binding protein [Streptomyces scabiei]MDX3824600.1 ATP/GTP-binding protein [Streptomyces scabiei]
MKGWNGSDSAPVLRGHEVTRKILVAGHFAAGKTTLIGSVSQITPVTTEEIMTSAGVDIDRTELPGKSTTTVAMDFGRLHLNEDLVLYLFGAPGQPRFFPILQDLARGALGVLVLADTRRLGDTYPILELIEDLALPYAVAINRFDGAPEPTEDRLREAMRLDATTPVVTCDARDRSSCRDALIALVRHLITLTPEPSR